MIPRYSTPEMTGVWSDTSKWARYLEVELLATEAHAAIGVVPAADADACRRHSPTVDAAFVAALLEREAVTDHDVAAFVDVVQSAIERAGGGGPAASRGGRHLPRREPPGDAADPNRGGDGDARVHVSGAVRRR